MRQACVFLYYTPKFGIVVKIDQEKPLLDYIVTTIHSL